MDHNTKASFLGGLFLSSFVHIGVEDVLTTIVLAFIGAIISYIASIILKRTHKNIKKKLKK